MNMEGPIQQPTFERPVSAEEKTWSYLLDKIKSYQDARFNFLAEALRGQPLLDLGCGDKSFAMLEFAYATGAASYTGVDKHIPTDLTPGLQSRLLEKSKTEFSNKNFPVYLVEDDLLSYLVRRRDESANITVNGIDSFLWPDDIPEVNTYIEELVRQIARVVPKGGWFSVQVRSLLWGSPEIHNFID